MKLTMGMLLASMSVFGAKDFSRVNQGCLLTFTGRHAKKQNKLSQSAKRKRVRQKGGKK